MVVTHTRTGVKAKTGDGARLLAFKRELRAPVLRALWAGSLATAAYDLVRVPLSAAGVPVFDWLG